jgi:hypothetical protein
MAAVTELANDVGTSAACQALCMPRASYYRERRKTSSPAVTASRPSPARALHPVEREAVLSRLHEERFQDRSPAAVYATLLDEGEYHCSIRTISGTWNSLNLQHGTPVKLRPSTIIAFARPRNSGSCLRQLVVVGAAQVPRVFRRPLCIAGCGRQSWTVRRHRHTTWDRRDSSGIRIR